MIQFIFLFLSFCATIVASDRVSSLQTKMLADLDFIKHSFDVKYAPKLWKEHYFGWDLEKSYQSASEEISNNPLELPRYHQVLKKFFNEARDYHVGIDFYATEKAELPFTIKGSQGKYFCVYVDRENETQKDYSMFTRIEEGDEILSFDGKPLDVLIKEIIQEDLGNNTKETDQALAELMLTSRNASSGQKVPQGDVKIQVRKRFSEIVENYTYTWKYTPEVIADLSKLKVDCAQPKLSLYSKRKESDDFFNKMMISPYFPDVKGNYHSENKHKVGGRASFIPKLGKKVWEADEASSFEAYIFTMPSSSPLKLKKIGYIRIPHYIADEDEAEEFCEIISQFQWRTSALVIDQINNLGGSLFYLYSLAAMLTDRPLATPKHHLLLTQGDIYTATHLVESLAEVKDDVSAKEILGETVGGYPVDLRFVQLVRSFCQNLLNDWYKGNLYSDATHLFGVDEIRPHPKAHYTKPILLLTNSLDFSAADFMPAIMQDNKRATILGTRTAGAGGFLYKTQFPNRTGIASFCMTASFAERTSNNPIENLGVSPDIFYEVTPDDIEGNYEGYVAAILKGVESILPKE